MQKRDTKRGLFFSFFEFRVFLFRVFYLGFIKRDFFGRRKKRSKTMKEKKCLSSRSKHK